MTIATPEDIDALVMGALDAFLEEIRRNDWHGREREAVSLFAFGALAGQCRAGSWLFDQRQIGIEVAVPQVPGRTASGSSARIW